jgi:4-oxalocrotonate tautomerase
MISIIVFRILQEIVLFGKFNMPTVFVYWYPGRNSEQKQKIAQRITDALVEDGNAKRESILIIFQETSPDNIARNGQLQSLPLLPQEDSEQPIA